MYVTLHTLHTGWQGVKDKNDLKPLETAIRSAFGSSKADQMTTMSQQQMRSWSCMLQKLLLCSEQAAPARRIDKCMLHTSNASSTASPIISLVISIRSFCRSNSRMMFDSAGRFICLFMAPMACNAAHQCQNDR